MNKRESIVRDTLPAWCVALAVTAMIAGGSPVARAQEANDSEELAAQATDPTAALMSFQLNDWYTPSFHGIGGSANQVVFRTALPFELAGTHHIFRLTAPYVTSSPSGDDGFADFTVFDLMTFDRNWGRFGIGVSGTLPTGADGLTLDKWTAGPALGFVNSSVKKVNWGLFAQTFFSYAGDDDAPDVGIINLQPVLSYQLGKGRSFSVGQQRPRLRHGTFALVVPFGQRQLRFRGRVGRAEVAPELRGRLRLQGRSLAIRNGSCGPAWPLLVPAAR